MHKVINELSRKIWRDLKDSHKHSLSFGEETITDYILLDLKRESNFNVRLIKTNKIDESKTGTDCEWFIGSQSKGWTRYVIQSKRLDTTSWKYKNLKKFVDLNDTRHLQADLLRQFANSTSAIPLYFLYNYYPQVDPIRHWHCDKSFDEPLLGWTFTTLRNVETCLNSRNSNSFDTLHRNPQTKPIRCLFECKEGKETYLKSADSLTPHSFLGESFSKVPKLPNEFVNDLDFLNFENYPELYPPDIKIVPKNVAIIQV